MSPSGEQSSYRAIENLIAAYAELVDDGDFEGVARLLADATFTGGAGSVSGGAAIEKVLRDNVIIYDDGTPRTKHLITNLAIEVDEQAGTAVARSYFTALQAVPDLSLQPIVSGRYTTGSNAARDSGDSSSGACRPISSAMSAATSGARPGSRGRSPG